MKIVSIIIFCSYVRTIYTQLSSNDERSSLDELIVPFRIIRRLLMDHQLSIKQQSNPPYRSNKLQDKIDDSVKFPCKIDNTRSSRKPNSVHRLRPGDIDVIAAIGDSLTAGYGLTANNLYEVLLEERGKSFSIGGEANWREFLTLPNILKEFNPNLIGYSLATSLTSQVESQFNVAEGGAISTNMPFMTKCLIERMKEDPRVNINEDWKMITFNIGSNDFCSEICYLENPKSSLFKHRNDLLTVLRLLRDNLPRTIVNIIPSPHLRILVDLKVKPLCDLVHSFICPCLFGLSFKNKRNLFYEIMSRWQDIDLEISKNSEFDLDDFTVVAQPFSINYTFPGILPNGETDHSYLSEDCFHFSQKLNANVANNLWNNIMEPVGRKTSYGYKLFEKFKCPSRKHPYIYTRRNSLLAKRKKNKRS